MIIEDKERYEAIILRLFNTDIESYQVIQEYIDMVIAAQKQTQETQKEYQDFVAAIRSKMKIKNRG